MYVITVGTPHWNWDVELSNKRAAKRAIRFYAGFGWKCRIRRAANIFEREAAGIMCVADDYENGAAWFWDKDRRKMRRVTLIARVARILDEWMERGFNRRMDSAAQGVDLLAQRMPGSVLMEQLKRKG